MGEVIPLQRKRAAKCAADCADGTGRGGANRFCPCKLWRLGLPSTFTAEQVVEEASLHLLVLHIMPLPPEVRSLIEQAAMLLSGAERFLGCLDDAEALGNWRLTGGETDADA